MTTSGSLRRAAARVSPRHRRWEKLLASLTLDPDGIPGLLPAPDPRSFVVCGSPRSGTALLVAMLFRPPALVTVMEPWDALRLPPRELFASLRAEVGTGRLTRGRLDIGALESAGQVQWCRDGEFAHPVVSEQDFLLGVKFPAYWRYLERLPETKFIVCLRHPLEVVSSYARTGGRLAEGFDYDVPFNRRMNDSLARATTDPAVRRVMLYDYIHERMLAYLDRPNVHTVRYERWFTEPDRQFQEVMDFLGLDLGRSAVGLHAPAARDPRDSELALLIRDRCRTAASLGYS